MLWYAFLSIVWLFLGLFSFTHNQIDVGFICFAISSIFTVGSGIVRRMEKHEHSSYR